MKFNQNYKYGLTQLEYAQMIVDAEGKCSLCKNTPKPGDQLVVDHDHQTNKVRGMLCGQCNTALGMFYDSAELLTLAASWINCGGNVSGGIFHSDFSPEKLESELDQRIKLGPIDQDVLAKEATRHTPIDFNQYPEPIASILQMFTANQSAMPSWQIVQKLDAMGMVYSFKELAQILRAHGVRSVLIGQKREAGYRLIDLKHIKNGSVSEPHMETATTAPERDGREGGNPMAANLGEDES